jgi:hypothetical protein
VKGHTYLQAFPSPRPLERAALLLPEARAKYA